MRPVVPALLLALLVLSAGCAAPTFPAPDLDPRRSVELKEHYQRGLELYRQGLLEGSLAEFKACLEIDPESADIHFQIGRILMERALKQNARLDVAADRLERAVRIDP